MNKIEFFNLVNDDEDGLRPSELTSDGWYWRTFSYRNNKWQGPFKNRGLAAIAANRIWRGK